MAAVALCCIGLFTTCKNTVGLGETVDINPPTLDVSTIYPPAGAVIRDTFVLSIEAKDDSGITLKLITNSKPYKYAGTIAES